MILVILKLVAGNQKTEVIISLTFGLRASDFGLINTMNYDQKLMKMLKNEWYLI
jgi:hypothetical protein